MSEARDRFVALFGEDAARSIEQAAEHHIEHGHRSMFGGYGSDRFRWAVLMVLSFQCVEVE